MAEFLGTMLLKTGFMSLEVKHLIMWLIGFLFIFLAIKKNYEPLLLLPIGFAIFIVNLIPKSLRGLDDYLVFPTQFT